MEVRDKMIDLGWSISNHGYSLLTENGSISNSNTVIAKALDLDIKDFGDAILTSLQKQKRTEKIILQIQKIRNVASPKSKEDSEFAPRMLKLILTDGHTTCQAVEVANVSFLSRSHTPPGSKLLLNGARIVSGCILLEPNYCKLLGGRVSALYEKWEIAKNISKNIRSVGSDGPPPWVNFGERIVANTSNEPFKALAEKNSNESTNEFDLHRQDAISNATTGAVKKVFGGGIKQPLVFHKPMKQFNGQEFNIPRNTRGSKNKGDATEKSEKPQKPQEKVSLFDFLEDKLPVNSVNDKCLGNESSISKPPAYIDSRVKNTPHNVRPTKNSYNQSNSYVRGQSNSYMSNQTNSYVGTQSKPYGETRKPPPSTIVHTSTQDNQNYKTHINELTKDMSKVTFDAPFAARSLKQHLNINPTKKVTVEKSSSLDSSYDWKVGDLCMAKYWEDGKYYNAVVTNLTQSTCVVAFNGYGNIEEVLKADCIPVDVEDGASTNKSYKQGNREFRSNRRNYSNKPFNAGNYYHQS